MPGDDKKVEASKDLLKEIPVHSQRSHVGCWTSCPALILVRTLSVHIFPFIRNMYKTAT